MCTPTASKTSGRCSSVRSKAPTFSVDPFHLFRYVDEQVFRFNEREDNDRGRFLNVASRIVGKRLTYNTLHRSGDDTRENVTNKPNRTSDEDRENEKANVPLTTGHICRKWLT